MKRYPITWLTGLPCSGKTTIARELFRRTNSEILDGDDIRNFMNNPDFSYEGIKKNMLTVAEMAYRFSKYTPVVVAMVSPIKKIRDEIMDKYENINMVYVSASLEECKRRDNKGMYKKALNGEIKNFIGVDFPYEKPNTNAGEDHVAFLVDTEHLTPEKIADSIKDKFFYNEGYSLFIGRWQPLHRGHKELISNARYKPLIGIKNEGIDERNPYSVYERIKLIEKEFPDAMILPLLNIKEVCYGRDVGYDIRQIRLSEEIEKGFSGTKIREEMKRMNGEEMKVGEDIKTHGEKDISKDLLIISNHLLNLDEFKTLKDVVIRINIAYVKDKEQLLYFLNRDIEIFIDYPENRKKPPLPSLGLDEVFEIIRDFSNVKYFALSNVEDFSRILKVKDNLSKDVEVVPKIETIKGVVNLKEIIEKGKVKFIMLDSEDLYNDVKGNNVLYSYLIDTVRNICKELNVKLLQLYGVIFKNED